MTPSFFKPEDFADMHFTLATPACFAADKANRLLAERGVRVYGQLVLIAIEPIKRESAEDLLRELADAKFIGTIESLQARARALLGDER